jgi:hypothetical protein
LPENSTSRFMQNPFGYYSCGFSTSYWKVDIVETIKIIIFLTLIVNRITKQNMI